MVFGITALAGLKFQWLLIGTALLLLSCSSFMFASRRVVLVALTLSMANLVGFWKCQKDAKQKLAQFLTQRVVQNI